MPTLLRYDIATSTFPLQASPARGNPVIVAVTVVASNPNPNPGVNTVTLQGVIVKFPVGSDGTDLTQNAAAIAPIAPDNWTMKPPIYVAGFVSFLFAPNPGYGKVGGAGLNFEFNNVQVNSQTGTAEIDVTEGSSGCGVPNCPVQPLFVTKFPNGWGQVSYSATPDPPIVPYNSGPTLQWAGPAGATYTIDYYLPQSGIVHVPAPNAPPLASVGVYPGQLDPPLQLTQSTTFYLTVTETINGVSYKGQQQITVTVIPPAPRITRFCATVKPAATGGISITFNWTTQDTQYCTLSCSASELTPNSPHGGLPMNLPQLESAYTLTAYNGGASDVSTLTAAWSVVQTIGGLLGPAGTAASADGSRVYLASTGSILIYATNADGTLTGAGSFAVGNWSAGFPRGIALSPDGSRLYVILMAAGIAVGYIQVFSTAGAPIGPAYPVGRNPWGVAASPDGTRVFVLNGYDGTISIFAASASTTNPLQPVGAPVPAGGLPGFSGLAVSPDGTRLFAGLGSAIGIFRITNDVHQPLQPLSQVTVGGIVETVGGIALGQGFPYLAAVLQEPGVQNGQVLLLDPVTLNAAVAAIPAGPVPTAVAVRGSMLYLSFDSGLAVYAPGGLTGGIGC